MAMIMPIMTAIALIIWASMAHFFGCSRIIICGIPYPATDIMIPTIQISIPKIVIAITIKKFVFSLFLNYSRQIIMH